MKYAAFVTICAIGTLGCGIPEEQHNEALNKIRALQSELGAEKDAFMNLEAKHGAATEQNAAMKKRLIGLGQDVSKLKSVTGRLTQDVTAKDREIAQLRKAQEAARRRAAVYKNLLTKFKTMIDSGKLRVQLRDNRMVVQLSDKILFASGKATLKKEGREALLEVIAVLNSVAGRKFQIAGHTDNVPIQTRRFASNWELSTARAVNVVKFMAENGLDPNRLSAAGYAEYDPVGDNNAEEGRQINRRIEITLVPNLKDLPGFSDFSTS